MFQFVRVLAHTLLILIILICVLFFILFSIFCACLFSVLYCGVICIFLLTVSVLCFFPVLVLVQFTNRACSHGEWLLLKWSTIGLGFDEDQTNCSIAHILGNLLMISY